MGKTKILLVEDDKNINKLITDYMSTHGFEVTSFEDGPDALDHVQMRGLPHISLIDLTLPTMHGFELSNRLKSMADVPIIFITATSDTETVVQGLKKYAEDFIVKPFELRELEARHRKLRRVLPLRTGSPGVLFADGRSASGKYTITRPHQRICPAASRVGGSGAGDGTSRRSVRGGG